MPPPAYSFNPQFATIVSQSPLSGMRPVVAAPEIRHTALSFERMQPIQIRSSQPELVTGGIASAISEGAGGALKGITAAYVSEREKGEAADKEALKFSRDLALTKARSEDTPEEAAYQKKYRDLSLQNIQSQIEQRGGDKKPNITPPVRSRGQFPTVEPALPSRSKPDFSIPEDAMGGLSALGGITPPIAKQSIPIMEGFFDNMEPPPVARKSIPIPADIFGNLGIVAPPEDELPLVETRPRTQGLVKDQVPFGQLQYESIDEGSAEELQKQPSPASLPPGTFPQTQQQMGDFAEQQLLARNQALQEITPALDEMQRREANAQGMEPVLVPGEVPVPVGPNEFLGRYESFQDAIYANEQLGKLLPGYQTQEVVEGVDENGMSFYEVKIPVRKAQGVSAAGVPEGMVVKQITDKDGQLTTTYLPKIPAKQQLTAFDNNIRKAKVLKETLEKIEELTPGFFGMGGQGAGGLSWLMAKMPWSNDAQTVRGLLDTVKGIIGFDELVALKAAGGTLGALSDAELSMLTSLQGSVDANLSEEVFLSNIARIKKHAEQLEKGLEADKSTLINVEKSGGFQSIQPQENRVEIKSQEDYNKLKSGQKYIWNGDTGTKK